jgi:hypothetical protein
MKYVYSRVTGTSSQGHADAKHRVGDAKFNSMVIPLFAGWKKRHDMFGDDFMWPCFANTAAFKRIPAKSDSHRTVFILQKESDGLWYIDPWNDHMGATLRPNAVPQQSPEGSWAQANSGVCFIIEIS